MNIDELFDRKPDGFIANQPYWFKTVDPKDLTLFRNYRRTYNEFKLNELTLDIANKGMLSEIMAFRDRGRLYVWTGHRRWLALNRIIDEGLEITAKHFDPHVILVKIFERPSEEIRIQVQMSENVSDRPDPADEAIAIYDLWTDCKRGKTYRDITVSGFARLIGKPETTVRDALRFIEGGHPKVIDAVHRKVITYTAGLLLAKVTDLDDQLAILQRVTAEDRIKAVKDRDILPKVREWILAHGEQGVLTLDGVQVISQSDLLKAKLQDGINQNYYRAIHWYSTISKAIQDGLLAKKLFTKAHLASIVRAVEVQEEVQEMLGKQSSLHVLARRMALRCDACWLKGDCPMQLTRAQCVNMLAAWAITEVQEERGDK